MAVITGTLVVVGISALVGAGIYISGNIAHEATEKDRAKENIKKLKADNEQLNSAKKYVDGIKTKLTSAKEYLIDAKNDFKNGGHVLDEVPLANSEFTSCINKLEEAIKNATNLINDFDATITKNNKDIKTEQAKLD